MATYGLEASHEALGEGESEGEGASPLWRAAYPHGEGEAEAETEAFFENLAEYAVGGGGGGGRGGGGGLAGVGRAAAQAALSRAPVAGVPLGSLATSFGDSGYIEGELEMETELEGFGGSQSAAMMMEHFGHAATLAESEAEAEAFILPLLPLAAKVLLPRVASFAAKKALPFAMRKVLPRLTRSALQVTRELRQNPTTRPLVRTMPTIVRRTVADIARQVERGRPVTPELATRYLAREAQRVLADPDQCVRAYKRSRALDRRYHHVCATRES